MRQYKYVGLSVDIADNYYSMQFLQSTMNKRAPLNYNHNASPSKCNCQSCSWPQVSFLSVNHWLRLCRYSSAVNLLIDDLVSFFLSLYFHPSFILSCVTQGTLSVHYLWLVNLWWNNQFFLMWFNYVCIWLGCLLRNIVWSAH
jgi:hypothetical protein